MEEKKKETKKTTKKKVATTIKKVEEIKQEVAQPTQPQMTMEQMQQMMMNMMQMMNAMQQNQVSKTVVEQPVIEEAKPKVENKKWTKSDLSEIEDEKVIVKSVVNNVGYISKKTGIQYNWAEKGDTEVMSIKDILAMETKSKRFLRTPWLVIEDKRIVEALKLEELYKLIERVEDVDSLIDMGEEEIKSVFEKLPNEYKKSFKNEVYAKVRSRELKDITVIESLSKILDIDLKDI